MRRPALFALGVLAALSIACGGSDSPSTPTAPSTSTPTRVMSLSGSLTFGGVDVGDSREQSFTISNTGTAPLAITGMTATGGFADHSNASWTSGTIAPGGSQVVTVRFTPKATGTFNGTFTVNGDQTSGANTLPITASGTGISAAGTWSGGYIVERCDGTGSLQDLFCSANRGAYPVGSTLPIALVLTQSGGNVTGTVYFGQIAVPVTGTTSASGVLNLQGTAAEPFRTTITNWSTQINGNTLSGPISFNIGSSSLPGVAGITARLSDVRR